METRSEMPGFRAVRGRALVASVILAAAVLAVGAPRSRSTDRSPSTDRSTAGIGLIQLGTMLPATRPSRYPLVVVSPGDAKAAAALPGRSLYYTSGVSVSRGWSDGVPWTQADENGWLLKDEAELEAVGTKSTELHERRGHIASGSNWPAPR